MRISLLNNILLSWIFIGLKIFLQAKTFSKFISYYIYFNGTGDHLALFRLIQIFLTLSSVFLKYPYFTFVSRSDTLLGFIRKYVNHCPAQQLTHSHWWWCIVCAMLTEWSMLSVCPDIYLDIRIQWYSHLHPASSGPRHNQISRYFSCSHYPTCKYIYCPSCEHCHPLLCETFSMEPKVDK